MENQLFFLFLLWGKKKKKKVADFPLDAPAALLHPLRSIPSISTPKFWLPRPRLPQPLLSRSQHSLGILALFQGHF